MPNLLDYTSRTPGFSTVEPPQPAVPFLKSLFGNSPQQHYLELRPVPSRCLHKTLRFSRLRQLQRRGFDQAVPELLSGKADVFFGVLPRSPRCCKAVDVEWAACIWADLDKGWLASWPAELPQPSIVVESSPARYHVCWLIAEGTDQVARVKALVHHPAVQRHRWQDHPTPGLRHQPADPQGGIGDLRLDENRRRFPEDPVSGLGSHRPGGLPGGHGIQPGRVGQAPLGPGR